MNQKDPLVSAVIIFLNGERFLEEAIESVLAQSYANIELLLIDDGSTDGSRSIGQRYVEQYPGRVRLLTHPDGMNHGMSASRNLGVAHCHGEFVAFIDADDVWLPEKTAEQLVIFAEHPDVAMVYGRTQIWHSWNAEDDHRKDHFCPLGVAVNQVYSNPQMLGNLVENRFQTPTTCNAIIARDAYLRLGGFEESFRGMYEDQAFFAKLYLEYSTYVADKSWARYRQHAGNSGKPFSYRQYYRERKTLMQFIFQRARPLWSTLDNRTRTIIRRERWRSRYSLLAMMVQHAMKWWHGLRS